MSRYNTSVQGPSVSNPGFGGIVYGRQVVVVSIWRHRHGMNLNGKGTELGDNQSFCVANPALDKSAKVQIGCANIV